MQTCRDCTSQEERILFGDLDGFCGAVLSIRPLFSGVLNARDMAMGCLDFADLQRNHRSRSSSHLLSTRPRPDGRHVETSHH